MTSAGGSSRAPTCREQSSVGRFASVATTSRVQASAATTSHVDEVKMNQLQNLIHDSLIATGHVAQCAIVKRKDCTLNASSAGFQLPTDDVQYLVDAFKNPAGTREEGLYFEDTQYKCVRSDRNSIYAKNGKKGLVLVRTQTLLLAATYTENMYPSVCVEAVEKLGDYFKEKGK